MPPYMNPVNDFYMRNAQQYGQQMLPFPPQQIQQMPHVNCRFVTGIEEAKAAMIDPLSYNLFLDSGSGKIYLKKLGNNGQSEFLCYEIGADEIQKEKDHLLEINTRLSNIEKFLGGKNNESVQCNTGINQSGQNVAATAAEQNGTNAETESAGFPKNAGNGWRKK